MITEPVEFYSVSNKGVVMVKQTQHKAKVERKAELKSSREGSIPVVVRSRSRAFRGSGFRITPKTPRLRR